MSVSPQEGRVPCQPRSPGSLTLRKQNPQDFFSVCSVVYLTLAVSVSHFPGKAEEMTVCLFVYLFRLFV